MSRALASRARIAVEGVDVPSSHRETRSPPATPITRPWWLTGSVGLRPTLAALATGARLALANKEFELLRFLMRNQRRVVSKAQILDRVWNYDFGGEVNVVESYVSYLRRKLDTGDKRLIHTLRGVGYVMREPRD